MGDRCAVAESTYREAIALAQESGQLTELAVGLAGLAWLQARRGRADECRTLAEEALALTRTLGIRLYEIWVTASLGELELGLGEPTSTDELTPQELQIALLLASGKTTREAAAALFLSPKTIEYHLRHVYLKLDIHSREELARELL